jgi:TolB-like protein/class 3 adenylate cyclase/Tfp pilus assembly protein PilF
MSAPVTHKLAAIVSTDVVGYSRLIGADEAGTLARMKAHRAELWNPEIEARGGRVVGTAGDSLLVEFASAVAAVECAIAVQQGMAMREADEPEARRMQLRIGVNVGEIVIDGEDILGDGVNVAARLEGVAEPGGIAISDDAYRQVRARLDIVWHDGGELELKNIAQPVHVWRWTPGGAGEASSSIGTGSGELSLPDKPSIAVLPFDNMSGDPEQEFFADGMTEDIITLLSTVPELMVIARNSTFTYKGRAVDVRKVAEELGVRYVLEGSIRKAGNRIRVTAQFIDARSGNHIWADRYDRDLEDIFQVQDEVTQGIAGALQSRLLTAELKHLSRTPPEKLDAWGNVVNAKLKLLAFRQEDIDAAEPFARRAVEIDPAYAEGHAVLGHILTWRCWNGWTDDFKQTGREALEHLNLALRLNPSDPGVLTDVGIGLWWLGRQEEGSVQLERAFDLNPSSPIALAMHGYSLCTRGLAEEGFSLCERALRLSPKDPLEYFFLFLLGAAHFHAGDYPAAEAALDRSLAIHPKLTLSIIYGAATRVKLGRIDEAKALLCQVETISKTAIPFIFRSRAKTQVDWPKLTDAIREAYDGPLPDVKQ